MGAHGIRIAAIALVCIAAGASHGYAAARCGDSPNDVLQVADVRERISQTCSCEGSETRGDYVRCARSVVESAKNAGSLSDRCGASVLKCAVRSTCGKPGSVTCCRTNRRGVQRCSIKKDSSKCTAPNGGTACAGVVASCCDACALTGGCVTQTPTPTRTPTATPPAICDSLAELPRIATLPMTIQPGSPDCGTAAFATGAQAPFSGRVDDAEGNKVADLGLGCLYVGALDPVRLPSGSVTKLDVVGINAGTIQLAGSPGTGNQDCTIGPTETTHCINGSGGTDGNGACNRDEDCGILPGACARDVRCFFGPPIPVSGALPMCLMSAFQTDMCGSINLSNNTSTLSTELGSRIYLSTNASEPCPLCVDGSCTAGARAGQSCVAAPATGTSSDCPPNGSSWLTTLPIRIPELTSGAASLSAPSGLVCPGQTTQGMFGRPEITTLTQTGAGPGASAEVTMTLVGAFCLAETNLSIVDHMASLPGPATLSTRGSVDLTALIGLPGLPQLPVLPLP